MLRSSSEQDYYQPWGLTRSFQGSRKKSKTKQGTPLKFERDNLQAPQHNSHVLGAVGCGRQGRPQPRNRSQSRLGSVGTTSTPNTSTAICGSCSADAPALTGTIPARSLKSGVRRSRNCERTLTESTASSKSSHSQNLASQPVHRGSEQTEANPASRGSAMKVAGRSWAKPRVS